MQTKNQVIDLIEKDIHILNSLPEDYTFIVISGEFGDHNDHNYARQESRHDAVQSLKNFKKIVEDYKEDEYINNSLIIIKDMDIFCHYETDGGFED